MLGFCRRIYEYRSSKEIDTMEIEDFCSFTRSFVYLQSFFVHAMHVILITFHSDGIMTP